MTSVISDAENTYEISSMLAFSSPCKYFNEEPTTSTLSIFKTKPLSRIKYINNFLLFIFINYTYFSDINTVDIKEDGNEAEVYFILTAYFYDWKT